MAAIRQRPLRPLSSATDLTDYTEISQSTIQPDSDPNSDGLADFESETQSLTPSIWDYVHSHGRTYHRYMAGAYPFPNDNAENERLDMQHAILKALLSQKNWFAPLKRPKRMLDIGCGTGRWCLEMAKEFPKARVEGIDLSPIQPDIADSTPANVDFFIDDIRRKEWWHCTQPYDYIHTRMSLGIFRDFREIIQKGFNNLEPGGYMESHEMYSKLYCDDGTMPPDFKLLEWTRLHDKAAMSFGTPLRIANKLKTWYEQAGFVDVREETHCIPINSWARDSRHKLLGKFMSWNLCQGVHAWSVEYFSQALQWTDTEVEVYLAHLRNSIGDRSVHAYYKMWVVYGRKPFPTEPPSEVPKPSHWPQEPSSDDEGDDDDN
ncbi:S-adenosyl-L-methionine-dependent methyltransferase [Phaeosphaeriaceae sp. PMI808]|nr:S-adenosyl-L-methionine-dependent methyltransferase [Phaeosphaeriaceae sp. PMI808]